MKTKALLLLALLLSGCSGKGYQRWEYNAQAQLIGRVKITMFDCLMNTKADDIYVEVKGNDRKLMIGQFSQWPDPATTEAVVRGAVKGLADIFLWERAVMP